MKKVLIIVGIIILAAIIIGGVVLFVPKSQAPITNVQNNTQTADWKKYTNTEYGFEFSYPQEYYLTIEKDKLHNLSESILVSNYDNFKYRNLKDDQIIFRVSIEKKNNITSYNIREAEFDNEEKNYLLSGLPAVKTTFREAMQMGDEYVTQLDGISIHAFKNKLSYYLEIRPFNEKVSDSFSKILSTFKFTDSKNQTADWKTYTNNDNGFEFKYPSYLSEPTLLEKNQVVDKKKLQISDSIGWLTFEKWLYKEACEESGEDYSVYQGIKTINGNNFNYFINNLSSIVEGYQMVNEQPKEYDFSHIYRVIHNESCYRITYTKKVKTSIVKPEEIPVPEMINKILSTFKFTK